MLKTTKSTSLNGSSVIKTEDAEQVAVTMNGSVNSDGSISFNWYMANKDVYEAHKTEVRKDIDDFQDMLYDLADNN